MKVARHAKRQTLRSKDALYAHAAMAKALIDAKRRAEAGLAMERMRERPLYWRLNDDKSVSPIHGRLNEEPVLEWARELEKFDNRQLARDDIAGCMVSTIFLGIDHGYGRGEPVLFETMAFSSATKPLTYGGRTSDVHEELEQRRYCTYAEAMAGHAEVCAEIRKTVAQLNRLKGEGE
ncbi:hypothetical protein [Paraburkholderia youngii]|uniref:hypothetical protein n=1 Tax=Paraburkholderia youngii TaxID=2782701 RepID=UPI001590D728|nr:hypothetical protein [Paraburkholderia youngii]NUX58706.1 hypothetical protein [Paraburkholderia youngii]